MKHAIRMLLVLAAAAVFMLADYSLHGFRYNQHQLTVTLAKAMLLPIGFAAYCAYRFIKRKKLTEKSDQYPA